MPAIAAIVAKQHDAVTLERDPLGHKPLYFGRTHGGFVYATGLGAILRSELLPEKRIDPVGLASAVWNGFVMSPATMVHGVQSVLPGERITLDPSGNVSRETVWSMPPAEPRKSTEESAFRNALHDSIRRSTDTTEPLGFFLSGGIDSASVANIARQFGPVKTFCMAMEDASLDESAAAAEIAKAIGSEHHTMALSEKDFLAHLDDALEALDQPTFDALNQYFMCRAVRDAGIKIAVGGIGGDAIFGGDKTLRQLPTLRRLARWSRVIPFRMPLAGLFAPKHSHQNWGKLPDVLKTNGDLISLYQLTYALFRPDFYEQLIAGIPDGLPESTRAWLKCETASHDPIETAAILEMRCFVGERLLRDADMVSSALSMELRSPLADARIIEEINRLPVKQKYLPVGDKPLLRRHGLTGLDPKLFDRPKRGFVLPFDRWLRTSLARQIGQTLQDPDACRAVGLNPPAVAQLWAEFQQRRPGIYWTRVWALYVIIRWCQGHSLRV